MQTSQYAVSVVVQQRGKKKKKRNTYENRRTVKYYRYKYEIPDAVETSSKRNQTTPGFANKFSLSKGSRCLLRDSTHRYIEIRQGYDRDDEKKYALKLAPD